MKDAIYKHGVVTHLGKQVFAYEVDGMGNYRLYDDANLPSLMSMPYLGFIEVDSERYQNTRKIILSAENKYYYFRNSYNGVGSSHTDERYVWPLALITQIMTSKSNN